MAHKAMYAVVVNMHISIVETDKAIGAICFADLATNTVSGFPENIFQSSDEKDFVLGVTGRKSELYTVTLFFVAYREPFLVKVNPD